MLQGLFEVLEVQQDGELSEDEEEPEQDEIGHCSSELLDHDELDCRSRDQHSDQIVDWPGIGQNPHLDHPKTETYQHGYGHDCRHFAEPDEQEIDKVDG